MASSPARSPTELWLVLILMALIAAATYTYLH
jgi:hypothetical protein